MKAYIAAPWEFREQARQLGRLLTFRGITVMSRWLTVDDDGVPGAQMDLDDIAASDILIALNPEGWGRLGTGGRHVEFGYALALKKPILLIGEPSNIFHSLVKAVDDSEDLVKHVKHLWGEA